MHKLFILACLFAICGCSNQEEPKSIHYGPGPGGMEEKVEIE